MKFKVNNYSTTNQPYDHMEGHEIGRYDLIIASIGPSWTWYFQPTLCEKITGRADSKEMAIADGKEALRRHLLSLVAAIDQQPARARLDTMVRGLVQ